LVCFIYMLHIISFQIMNNYIYYFYSFMHLCILIKAKAKAST
jgi:hypothetical protein